MAKRKKSKRHKIGTIDEFMNIYKNEWLLLEVLESSELDEPTVGRMIAHSASRTDIYEELMGSTIKDVVLLYSGEIPKPGTMLLL